MGQVLNKTKEREQIKKTRKDLDFNQGRMKSICHTQVEMLTSTLNIADTLKGNVLGVFFSCGKTGKGTLCSMIGDDFITFVE